MIIGASLTTAMKTDQVTRTAIRDPHPGDALDTLDTPVVVIDLDRMENNIREWQSWMDQHSVRFRPHIKTHKIPEIALLQINAGASGIVCAKISEAEPFAAAGVRDICIAYPVFGTLKWRRIAEMAASGVRVTVNCDNETAARGLSEAASAANVTLNLQVDIDTGLNRGGIPFSDVAVIESLSRVIQSLPGLRFDGITTFRSNSYPNASNAQDSGHDEGRLLVELAKILRTKSIEVRNITAGSSPTGRWVAEVGGITEVRAGTYIFNDLMQLRMGAARRDQLAISVLCTVVSRGKNGRVTIDGGSKTFSGDIPKPAVDRGAASPIAEAIDLPIFVERLSEEHGIARSECDVELGEKIRFVPYHACTCLNMADKVVGVRGETVEVVWPIAARGLRA
jgi:D-serine deaminase-like pyridoxal phosphate-dependent protein